MKDAALVGGRDGPPNLGNDVERLVNAKRATGDAISQRLAIVVHHFGVGYDRRYFDRSFVSDLEVGKVNPTYLQLRALAETLRLSLASLIDFKTP